MINSVGSSTNSVNTHVTKKSKPAKKTSDKNKSDVVLEISNNKEKKVTYEKNINHSSSINQVHQLHSKANQANQALRDLVERLVVRQGGSIRKILDGRENLKLDNEAIADAQQLISKDGDLGVKKVSDRILNFAKALAGEDKSKIPELRNAIIQGFKEAERIMGQLPDISKRTYDEVMNKLEEWEKE